MPESQHHVNLAFSNILRWVALVLTLHLFAHSTLHGQDSTITLKPKRGYMRLAIGPMMAVTLNYRLHANTDGNSAARQVIDDRNNNEIMSTLLRAGLTSCYMVNRNLGVEFGTFYSLQGFETDKEYYKLSAPSIPDYTLTRFRFTYVDLVMRVNYLYGKGRARLVTVAGFTTSVLFSSMEIRDSRYSYGLKSVEKGIECSAVNFSPELGLGFHWDMSPNVAIRLLPTFRFGVVPITNDPYDTFTYSGGFEICMLFGE